MKLTKSRNPFRNHKKSFPVSYSFVEIIEFNKEVISEELPVYVKVNFYQTSKLVPYSFYKPITSGIVLKQNKSEESI